MTVSDLSKFIKNQALALGFGACGITKATPLPESETVYFNSWLRQNFHAGMQYMEKNSDKRYNPCLLIDDCSSIVVVAMNYKPTAKQDPKAPKIADFAYGKDYHSLIRTKLNVLLRLINEQGQIVHGRAFTDSAPIAERYWAMQSGLGWIGKNHQLIIPQKGSRFFLGELMVDTELDYDCPQTNHCGSCQRCIDACPTCALTKNSSLDARRCLSYLTIEKHGDFSLQEASTIEKNDWLFGCDICQDVCPWNRFSKESKISELQAKAEFLSMKKEDYKNLSECDFKRIFGETCLERIGYKGLIRNLNANKA